KLEFTIQTDNVSAFAQVETNNSVADGQLHHVAAVVNRSTQTLSFLLDGVLQQSTSTAGVGDISNGGRFFIGVNSQDIVGSSAVPFNGVIDELDVFSRA